MKEKNNRFIATLLVLLSIFLSFHLISCLEEEFFSAARSGDIKILEEFVAKGASANARDSKGNSALVIASGRGQLAAMSFLIQNGAFVEDVTQQGLFEGKSALCWAASQGRAQAVGLLLQAGADPNRQPERGVFQGKTALMWASSQGRVSVIRLLLSSGVDVNFFSNTGNFKVIVVNYYYY